MSDMDRFEAWWKTLGVHDPIQKALSGSAWMEAIRASKPIPPDPHIVLMEAEHDDRMQPQPAEDPDEWVIQDRVPVRLGIDMIWWHGDVPHEYMIPPTKDGASSGRMHGSAHPWNANEKLRVWCRRRDLPKVEQCIESFDCANGDHSDACPVAALAAIDARLNQPQPQKTRVRLWIDPDCNVHAGLKGDRDLELFYDHETRQFYTEEQC